MLNNGLLAIQADSNLGAVPGGVLANSITLSNGGRLSAFANFTLNSNRGITLSSTSNAIYASSGSTLTYNGIIAGSGSLDFGNLSSPGNTGTVILEALVSGLPVLTTEAPGYAHYVKEASMGEVISLPFSQEKLNIALQKLLVSQENFVENSKIFAKNADIYDLHEHAVKKIELWGASRALFTS